MAETRERSSQVQSSIESEKDAAKDSEHVPSESVLEDPTGMDRPHVRPAEVMSLKECCREAFGKITEYLRGELAGMC